MIVKAESKLYLKCPACKDGEWEVGHLTIGFYTDWSCHSCRNQFHICRVGKLGSEDFMIEATGWKDVPITVTLVSDTIPPITVKVNAWKYSSSKNSTKEEFESHERYFYDEHTCPTNWLRDIEEIEFKGDKDPHGVFQFVSVEEGHYTDPQSIESATPDEQKEIEKMTAFAPISIAEIRKMVKQLRGQK